MRVGQGQMFRIPSRFVTLMTSIIGYVIIVIVNFTCQFNQTVQEMDFKLSVTQKWSGSKSFGENLPFCSQLS